MPNLSLARFLQLCWTFILSIFSFRNRKHISTPELPTSANHGNECIAFDGLDSWQRDKQQFLRRPSLVKASHVQVREPRKKKQRAFAPPPEIYVQDWSSVGINMEELFYTPAAVPPSAVAEADSSTSSGPSKPIISEEEPGDPPVLAGFSENEPAENSVNANHAVYESSPALNSELKSTSSIGLNQISKETGPEADSAVSPFPAGPYASNALSAVSGLLFDLPCPSLSIPHSTPLPDAASTSTKSRSRLTLTPDAAVREGVVPYPDLFDFGMYARRVSRDSFYEVIELPSLDLGLEDPADKKYSPTSIYDVRDRDRYRGAAYSVCLPLVQSSPPRRPFASTLNLQIRDATAIVTTASKAGSEQSDKRESLCWVGEAKGDVAARCIEVYDELSRCEWTEEEFLKMFASSTTV